MGCQIVEQLAAVCRSSSEVKSQVCLQLTLWLIAEAPIQLCGLGMALPVFTMTYGSAVLPSRTRTKAVTTKLRTKARQPASSDSEEDELANSDDSDTPPEKRSAFLRKRKAEDSTDETDEI